jgi:hypothetical protein
MLLGAEEPDLAIPAAEGLETLEQSLPVVQHRGRRVQVERSVRLDPGVVPALLLLKVHHEHVVGEDGAEAELGVLRLGLLRSRPGDADRVTHETPAP